MKKLIMILISVYVQNTFAWFIAGVHCNKQTDAASPDFKTYTYVNLEAGPDAVATLIRSIELENNPPNVGNGMTDYNQYGFFKSRQDNKSNVSIIDQILGRTILDNILVGDGTLFSQKGDVKQSRLEIIITKRFSDGEANEARLNIFTKTATEVNWTLADSIENCSLSVYH